MKKSPPKRDPFEEKIDTDDMEQIETVPGRS